MAWGELRGAAARIGGRDGGATLLDTVPLTRDGQQVRDEAARIVLSAPTWAGAVETVRNRWDARTCRRAAAMLAREDFDEFVVFSIRTTNEVLRQSVEGRVTDRTDLKVGLEYEARLNRLSPAAVFAEAARSVPRLGEVTAPSSTTVESALREYARTHGPVPSILLDASARHLARS